MQTSLRLSIVCSFLLVVGLIGQARAQPTKTIINRPCTTCEPRATEAADFNSDGVPDLVVSDNVRGELHLYVGTGSGSGTDLLGPQSVLSDASAAEDFATGDVDGDGNKDLVAATGSDIVLFPGNGDGTFQSSVEVGNAISQSVVVANFDGVNGPDIATSDTFNDELIVFFNDGTGSFGAGSTTTADGSLQSISVGDVGGDADMDVIGASIGDNLIQLFENDGTGNFTTSQVDGSLPSAGLVVATSVNVNEDSNLDLVAYSNNSDSSIPTLLWYPGNGDGTFGARQSISSEGVRLFDLLTFDIGSNGVPDLVTVGTSSGTRAFLNDGQGSFTTTSIDGFKLGFGGDPLGKGDATVTDLNGDQNQDFVGVAARMDAVELRAGDGTGSFSPDTLLTPPDIQVDPQGNFNLATGDVDGNGETDVVLGTAFSTSELVWYANSGFASFQEKSVVDPRIVEDVAVMNFDGDGSEDILAADLNDGLEMYEWNGNGGFTDSTLVSSSIGSFAVADVDDNAHPDVVFGNFEGLSVALNNGDGTFTTSTITGTVGSVSDIAVAEVTEDGNLDVLYADNNDEKVVYYPGNGDGTFGSEQIITSGDFGRRVIARDIDGDNLSDVVASIVNGDVGVFINSGSGSFVQDATYPGTTIPLALTDVSQDGAPDLLQGPEWRKNNDIGDFGSRTQYATGLSALTAISYGQIDQNSSIDPLTLDSGTDALAWYDNAEGVLPVELTQFDAEADRSVVHLTWQTASEQGNAGFAVQRRVGDAKEPDGWTQIGFVDSEAQGGTTTEAQTYRFTDSDLPFDAKTVQYRLMQVDTDGSSTPTRAIKVQRPAQTLTLRGAFPNPARSTMTVQYAVPSRQDVSLKLFDALGRRVKTLVDGRQNGRQEVRVDVSSLPSGVYFVRLSTGRKTRTTKLSVVH